MATEGLDIIKSAARTRAPSLTQLQNRNALGDLQTNLVAQGDCVEFMRRMPAGCVDLTVTSPPYDDLRNYKGYAFDFEAVAEALLRVTADGGVAVWVVGDQINGGRSLTSFKQALFFQSIGWTVHNVMIYRKKNTPFMRSNAYTNAYEFMFVLSKGKPQTFNPPD